MADVRIIDPVIGSPCVGVCTMHEKFHVCKGCLRSKIQIKMWPVYSGPMKLKVLEELRIRREVYGDINEPNSKSD